MPPLCDPYKCTAIHTRHIPFWRRHSVRRLRSCRGDLRLSDNPALVAAIKHSAAVLPVYVFDRHAFERTDSGECKASPASVRFLLDSVEALRGALQARGAELVVRRGAPEEELRSLALQVGASAVHCCGACTDNPQCCEPATRFCKGPRALRATP